MRGAASAAPAAGVRRAGVRDLDRVAALWSAVAAHHAALDPGFRAREDAADEVRALLARDLGDDARSAVFVWESGGDLAGFCCVRIDVATGILAERERAEISDLGVREGARRRGIGRALVTRALAWIGERGVERVEVRVASGNREGQAFWRALGFADHVDVLQRRL